MHDPFHLYIRAAVELCMDKARLVIRIHVEVAGREADACALKSGLDIITKLKLRANYPIINLASWPELAAASQLIPASPIPAGPNLFFQLYIHDIVRPAQYTLYLG